MKQKFEVQLMGIRLRAEGSWAVLTTTALALFLLMLFRW